jgi:hypothetical protein
MSKIIVHLGTGTYFDADDSVYIVDTNHFDFDPETFEADMEKIVADHGMDIAVGFYPRNIIDYSPRALRDEALAIIEYFPGDLNDEDMETMKWAVAEATDVELEMLGAFLLNRDEVWTDFRSNVIDGLRQRKYIGK